MMNIIDHGEWVQYKPDPNPFPLVDGMSVLFCRRISDGRDWYDFHRKELTSPHSIYMTLMKVDRVVRVTTRDATTLFPAGMQLIEVTGVTEDHELFRQKRFDPERRAFETYDPPKIVTVLDLIVKELGWDDKTIRRKLEEANKHIPHWRLPDG